MYKCSKCKKTGVEGFISYAKSAAGVRYYYCNECNAARGRLYRSGDSGKIAAQNAVKKYQKANPKRRNAWYLAKKEEPELRPCEVCGSTQNIHRHHPDIEQPEYSIFLCAYHHKQAHKTIVELA